jgi:hypothetical protein
MQTKNKENSKDVHCKNRSFKNKIIVLSQFRLLIIKTQVFRFGTNLYVKILLKFLKEISFIKFLVVNRILYNINNLL